MNGRVSTASMVFMGVSAVLACALPFILFALIRKRKKADILPFFVGFAVFALFALLAEGLLNNLIIVQLPVGKKIRANIWLYAAYGGLMAGLFEETGRFAAFKTVLKKRLPNDSNALMYGAGHGGMEAVAVAGLGNVSNLVLSIMINSGSMAQLIEKTPPEMRAALEQTCTALSETQPVLFLLGAAERCIAIVLHISLSVLVWFAAKKKHAFWLYPAAILLHAAVDAAAVLLSGAGFSALAAEGAFALAAAVAAAAAFIVWKRFRAEDRAE